jgi:hypothetical protein
MSERVKPYGIFALALGVTLIAGCKERSPDRELFPQIKVQVVKLQDAVKQRDRGPLEALLTKEYAAAGGADSVVQFSFGAGPDFHFAQYGKAVILYTDQKARVDCVVMDSLGHELRPATLTFEHAKETWLLKRIEPQLPPPDTTSE